MCNNLKVFLITTVLFLTACSSPGYTREGFYEEDFSAAELDQMLAPIALYPDALLSQILMAATYPEEVREAATWSIQYPELEGQAAVNAVAAMPWDPSVKAMVAFPELLSRMDADSLWIQRLGDAYLMQEADVLDSIQRLRDRAYAAGNLGRLDHVRVYRQDNYIYIDPIDPHVIYIPYYHPVHFYSNWWWPDYPPHYWSPPSGYHSGVHFYWGRGFHVAPVFFFSTFHWHNRHIVVYDSAIYRSRFYDNRYRGHSVRQRYEGAQRWRHDPAHRHGVRYPQKLNQHYSRQPHGNYDRYRFGRGDPRVDRYSHRDSQNAGEHRRSDFPQRDERKNGRYNHRERDSRYQGSYDRQRNSSSDNRDFEHRSPAAPDQRQQDHQSNDWRNPDADFRHNNHGSNPGAAPREAQGARDQSYSDKMRRPENNRPAMNPRQSPLQRLNTAQQQQIPGRSSYREQTSTRKTAEDSMRQRSMSDQPRTQPEWRQQGLHRGGQNSGNNSPPTNSPRNSYNDQAPRERAATQSRAGSDNWRNPRSTRNPESPRNKGGFGDRSHSQR
ncbi:MAG: DUF3300 domain-containing protein [Porticoccaceae bacterium]